MKATTLILLVVLSGCASAPRHPEVDVAHAPVADNVPTSFIYPERFGRNNMLDFLFPDRHEKKVR